MKMYIEPEMEIIRFEECVVDTIVVSPGDTPGNPDIGYDEI